MRNGMAAVVALSVGLAAALALADRTAVVATPTDGGSASVSPLIARKTVEFFNAEPVAVCIVSGGTATPASPCRPVLPGGSMAVDASDAHPFSIRRCSSTTVASCLPDGGVVVTEIQ